jgi:hypothetical protein
MKQIIFYRLITFLRLGKNRSKDLITFSHLKDLYGPFACILDRTSTLKFPINISVTSPIPKFENFNKSYKEVCLERARVILERADKKDKKIALMYSGGIDSVLILCLLLQLATESQKNRLVIFLSEDSINEYPEFYKKYIQGKLKIESVFNIKYILDTEEYIIVNGQHNDQIFGSGNVSQYVRFFGVDKLKKEFTQKDLLDFYNKLSGKEELNKFYVDYFGKLFTVSPIKLISVLDHLWWLDFCLRWQHGEYYYVTFFTQKKLLSKNYMETNYVSFFDTNDFQLWSMNNLDKRIKDTWESYKYPAKEIILEFTNDKEYFDNKVKGLSFIPNHYFDKYSFITNEFELLDYKVNFEEIYNPNSDFK